MHCGNYTRREFLRKSSLSLGAMAFASSLNMLPALANSDGTAYKALVFVYMGGGNDAWNTVVPMDNENYGYYQSARPVLAIPKANLLSIQPRSDSRPYGLSPNLPKLKGLWDSGKMAAVVNLGNLIGPITPATARNDPRSVPGGLFGHDTMGAALMRLQSSVGEGWGQGMSKYFDPSLINPGPNSGPAIPMFLNVGPGDSVYLAGTDPYLTVAGYVPTVKGNSGSSVDNARYTSLRNMLGLSSGSALVNVLGKRTGDAIDQSQLISSVIGSTTISTPFFGDSFYQMGPQLQEVAKLIKARATLGQTRRQIFFVNFNAFDNHGEQKAAHQYALQQVDDNLKAFYDATVELGVSDQVTTFVAGEFGRTVQCSGDGSDHAWGGIGYVVGDAVNGGDFYGSYPSLKLGGPDDLDAPTDPGARGRIVPTTSVEQFGATLAKWFGVSDSNLGYIFPNLGRFSPADLGFMKSG